MTPGTESAAARTDPRPRAWRWAPDVVATAAIVLAAFLPPPVPVFQPTGTAATVLFLLPVLVLPLRRRWPLPTLIACLALFGLTALTGTLSPGAGLATAVATFQVTTRSTRRTGLVVGGVAAVALMAISVPVTIGSVFDPRVLQFGLLVAFATAAGDGARSHRAYIVAITERAERAERTREAEARRRVTEERLRIARDLHDAVAHQIAVISLNAGAASSAIDTKPQKAKDALVTIRSAARTVLAEIGDLLNMLRSDDDRPGAGTGAPQPGLEQLDGLVGRFAEAGLDVTVRREGDLARASGTVGTVGYRVVQEALTNAHKHGAEHRAHVLVEADADSVSLTVTNPAVIAADAAVGHPGPGHGLTGLRERVASVRGTLHAGSTLGGWEVVAILPLPKQAAA
ncbi:sensor histidine kinase [Promicromonospora soli]